MSERFFVSLPISADRAVLVDHEAHHLAHVMRGSVGDVVTLFDGSGCEFRARVERIGKTQVELAVLDRSEVQRESDAQLTLAVALPKGDRGRWLVEKAVELGVAAVVPLETQRGVAQPSDSALAKLRRAVIEASKQCGRNRLMEIAAPRTWSEFAAAAGNSSLRILAHPGGTPLRQVRDATPVEPKSRPIIAAIGPEGGFTDAEVAHAVAAGWIAVDLGRRILRVETAALSLAAWADCG